MFSMYSGTLTVQDAFGADRTIIIMDETNLNLIRAVISEGREKVKIYQLFLVKGFPVYFSFSTIGVNPS